MVLFNKGSAVSDDDPGTTGRWFGIETSGNSLRISIDDDNKQSVVAIDDISNVLPYSWTHIVGVRDAEVKAIHGYAAGVPEKTGNGLDPVQNYPNPFVATTTFKYYVAPDNDVQLSIYNLSCRLISTVVDQYQHAGTHSLTFDAVGMESGIFMYELKIGSKRHQGKMILLK